jgi:hypothetical protein
MTLAQRLSASRRKKAADPRQQSKSGSEKPTYVSTDKPEKKMNEEKDVKGKGSGKKDACYKKVKSRYDVWPSAYASGALVKCRKVGAANWGTKTEEASTALNYDWDTPIRERADRYCPKCGKLETRNECKYGVKYWDMFSLPAEVVSSKDDFKVTLPYSGYEKIANDYTFSTNQMKYNTNRPHPANESKEPDHEYSMARSELSTIISAAKRLRGKLKGEGNIEAWVQSKITKAADYIDAAADYLDSGEHDVEENVRLQDANGNDFVEIIDIVGPNNMEPVVDEACWKGYKQVGLKKKGKKVVPNCVPEQKSFGQFMEDWQKVNRKDKTDGLSQAAVKAYRRENPGSKLQTAVTEKNPTGKREKRRSSFCSRMKGMKSKLTSAETARDPDSRINKALRRWRCGQ